MIEFIIHGLALGAAYALLALPLSLVWATTRTLDLSVGGYAVLAGFAFASVTSLWVGVLAAAALGAACGLIMGVLLNLLRSRHKPDPIAAVLLTVGVLFALSSLTQVWFGVDPVHRSLFDQQYRVGDLRISPQTVINLAVVGLVLAAITAVLKFSRVGRDMRAAADSPDDAVLVGIDPVRLRLAVMVIAGVLAGLTGTLIVLTSGMSFEYGMGLSFVAVGAVILFGMRGPAHAVAGGLTIGVVEAVAAGYAPGGYGPVGSVVFVFAVLASGIFDFHHEEVRP